MVRRTSGFAGWVTGDRRLCEHRNAYFNDAVGTRMCPDCNSMELHGFMDKRTGERLGHEISGEQSAELEAAGALGFWHEWVPNPGAHPILPERDERRRQHLLSRALESSDEDEESNLGEF